ncbi:MAG: hypothetical protein IPG94_25200 [Kineosporiaceae bacterium]|nr:hypothetical protein [Kineosporiaceae bacterium]
MTTMLLILVTAIAPCPFDAAGSAGDPLVWSAPVALLVAGVLAVPVSVGLLFLYRRAVVRRMRTTAVPSGSRALAEPPLAPAALPPPLLIAVSEADGPAGPDPAAEPFVHRAFGDLRRAGAVQLAGGAAFGVVAAVTFLRATATDFTLLRFLVLFWVGAWPGVLTASLAATVRWRARVELVAGYGIGYAVLIAAVVLQSDSSSVGQLLRLWVLTDLAQTLLICAYLARRIRAVGPLVLSSIFIADLGLFMLIGAAISDTPLSTGLRLGYSLAHLPPGGLDLAILVLALGACAVAALAALSWIGRRYRDKAESDQSITLDALVLIFGAAHGADLSYEGWYWAFAGLAAFAAYRIVTTLCFRWISRRPRADGRLLVLLRVFALGRREVGLLDVLGSLWRRQGPIALIAGPDLVSTTVEPHEFLDFVSGRLDRNFVHDQTDLALRLSTLDHRVDPDGRYRINEFFCFEDTWRSAVASLVVSGDAILMDLRGFSAANSGCIYELGLLLDLAPLTKSVLLVDESTDERFLHGTLHQLWARVSGDSPNRRERTPAVRLVRARSSEPADSARVLLRALAAASSRSSHPGRHAARGNAVAQP